ncbi:MAG: hypothetical protein WKF43_07965 [Acidimicrobiales bacterium]
MAARRPLPRADVEDWDKRDTAIPLADAYDEAVGVLRGCWPSRPNWGAGGASAVGLTDDPVPAPTNSPRSAFGPADQQRVLATEAPEDRLVRVRALLGEEAGYLGQRIAMG